MSGIRKKAKEALRSTKAALAPSRDRAGLKTFETGRMYHRRLSSDDGSSIASFGSRNSEATAVSPALDSLVPAVLNLKTYIPTNNTNDDQQGWGDLDRIPKKAAVVTQEGERRSRNLGQRE